MNTGATLPRKLNIGCGSRIREGWVNLDSNDQPGVDVVRDIQDLPLPFPDNHFDEVLAQDILEHVEYISVLKDLHRIMAPGGKLHVRVPHYSSRNNFTDPTHIKRFSVSTFDYFAKGTYIWERKQGEFYFDFAFERIENLRLNFDKTSARLFRWRKLMEWWVNSSPRQRLKYEMTGRCYVVPASDIVVTFVK